MTEAFQALVDQGWWSLPERHHQGRKQHLKLPKKVSLNSVWQCKLLLAGLLDGIDLRHLGHPAEQW